MITGNYFTLLQNHRSFTSCRSVKIYQMFLVSVTSDKKIAQLQTRRPWFLSPLKRQLPSYKLGPMVSGTPEEKIAQLQTRLLASATLADHRNTRLQEAEAELESIKVEKRQGDRIGPYLGGHAIVHQIVDCPVRGCNTKWINNWWTLYAHFHMRW